MANRRLNIGITRRGVGTIAGQVARTPVESEDGGGQRPEGVSDKDLMLFLFPSFDQIVREVSEEVEAERLAGRLKPFVEGTAIGALPRRVRVKRKTEAQRRAWRNQLNEERRSDMLSLREKNNQTMEDLLNERW